MIGTISGEACGSELFQQGFFTGGSVKVPVSDRGWTNVEMFFDEQCGVVTGQNFGGRDALYFLS